MKKNQDKPAIIILCGGKGLRLRPITKDIPKPLVMLNDKPILQYILNQFIKYRFNKFLIATGYKSNKIKNFLKNNFQTLDYKIINSGDVDILTRIRDCNNSLDPVKQWNTIFKLSFLYFLRILIISSSEFL